MIIAAANYGARSSASDNSAALNKWIAAIKPGDVGLLDGAYRFTEPLRIADRLSLRILAHNNCNGYQYPEGFIYAGDPTKVAVTVDAVRELRLERVTISGNAATLLDVVPGFGPYSQVGWHLDHLYLNGGTAAAFHIGGETNCSRFLFEQCHFQPAPTGAGLRIDNANSVSHTLLNCGFERGRYGLVLNGGSANLISCEFALQSIADIYLMAHSPMSITGAWSEQSNRFLVADGRAMQTSLKLSGCNIVSFPADYKKTWDIAGNPEEWSSIIFNRTRALVMESCLLGSTVSDRPGARQPIVLQQIQKVSEWHKVGCAAQLPGPLNDPQYTDKFFAQYGFEALT